MTQDEWAGLKPGDRLRHIWSDATWTVQVRHNGVLFLSQMTVVEGDENCNQWTKVPRTRSKQ